MLKTVTSLDDFLTTSQEEWPRRRLLFQGVPLSSGMNRSHSCVSHESSQLPAHVHPAALVLKVSMTSVNPHCRVWNRKLSRTPAGIRLCAQDEGRGLLFRPGEVFQLILRVHLTQQTHRQHCSVFLSLTDDIQIIFQWA